MNLTVYWKDTESKLWIILALLFQCILCQTENEDGNNEDFPIERARYSSWMDGKGNWWIAGGIVNKASLDDIWHYNASKWTKVYDLDSEHHRSHPNISAGSILCACATNLVLSIPKRDVNETEIWVYDGKGWTTYLCLSDDESSPCPHTKAVFTVCDSANSRILLIDIIPPNSVKRRVWSFDAKKHIWQQESASILGVEPKFEECITRWNSVDGVAIFCPPKLFWLDLEEFRWFEFEVIPFNESSIRFFMKWNDLLLAMLVDSGHVILAVSKVERGFFKLVDTAIKLNTGFIVSAGLRIFCVPTVEGNRSSFKIEREIAMQRDFTTGSDEKFSFIVLPLLRPNNETLPSNHAVQESFVFLYVLLSALFLLAFVICILLCFFNRTGITRYRKTTEVLSCRVPASPVRYTAIKDESFLQ